MTPTPAAAPGADQGPACRFRNEVARSRNRATAGRSAVVLNSQGANDAYLARGPGSVRHRCSPRLWAGDQSRTRQRGAHVVAVDIDEPTDTLAQLEQAGHKATSLQIDVPDPDQTAQVGPAVREIHGRCDILVNNAGIYLYLFVDIDELTYETWRKVMAVNLDSQSLMTSPCSR